jgi:hypothetical protein
MTTSRRPKRTPVSEGPCFVCGTAEGPFDENHVAGYPNEPHAVLPLCRPCHAQFTALQRSVGIAKPGPAGTTEYVGFGPFGKAVALAQGGIFHLILAVRQRGDLDPSWEPFVERLSRSVSDLAAKAAREADELVPLPDPLADEGDPA